MKTESQSRRAHGGLTKCCAFVVLVALAILAACESTRCLEGEVDYPDHWCMGIARDCCSDPPPAAADT